MYYSRKITGDVLNVLDMLFAVSQGGKAGGKGGSKTLAGADGNTQIVISADIDASIAGALVGKVVGNDITEDNKKLEESIKKAKKGESGNKDKGGSETKVEVSKNVERQVKKLSPEAKKGYDKAIDALKNGNTQGLNEHPLSGDRKGQWAVDMKGTGKGRGKGRIIYEKGKDGTIKIIEILTDHNY